MSLLGLSSSASVLNCICILKGRSHSHILAVLEKRISKIEKVNSSLERTNETLAEAKEELKKENKVLGERLA